MKFILSLLFSFYFYLCNCQIKHEFIGVITAPASGPKSIETNVWYKTMSGEATAYIQFFNTNTVGAKKAIDLVKKICIQNGLDFFSPDQDNSYLASYIKSIDDFENLNLSVSTGGSIIDKQWNKKTDSGRISLMILKLDEGSYVVTIAYPK